MKDVESGKRVQFSSEFTKIRLELKKYTTPTTNERRVEEVKKGTQDGNSKMYSSRSTTRTLCVRIHAVEAVLQPHLYFSKRVYVLRIRTPLTFPHTVVWLR